MYPETINTLFESYFGKSPEFLCKAPGRINLIGEHTDYNGGFVMPAAMDKAIYFAVSKREDNICRVFSENMNEFLEFSLDHLENTTPSWANYIKGVLAEFEKLNASILGFDMVFGGDIPAGAGVSSSAALECGVAFCVDRMFNLQLEKIELVQLAQAAENNFVGVKCGIMDQFASMFGRKNEVIQLDCRSLEYKYFPFEMKEYVVVLCDTGVKHNLGDSEYNTRRAECEAGVKLLQKYYPEAKLLRDVSLDQLKLHKDEFEQVVYNRCLYVVSEIDRVERACKFLEKGNLTAFGGLMYETHDGLQNLYEVSCKELDFLVENSNQFDSVIGARMMGGGFGGCTINLVKKDAVAHFVEEMTKAYQNQFGLLLKTYITEISNGVSKI